MRAKLTPDQRLKLIERALNGEEVVKICKESGVSRVLFYRWLKKYKKTGEESLAPGKAGRPIEKVIPKPHLQYTKLSPSARLNMVMEVIEQDQDAEDVAKRYGISRVTLYKWIKRYKSEIRLSDKPDLSSKVPHIDHYYRETPEKHQEAVLALVAKHPEYGIRSLVRNLPKIGLTPIVGHHGVQNILRRHGLLHYVDRRAYAQAQITPVTITIGKSLEPVFSFFKISLELRQKIVKSWSTIAFGIFSLIVVLGLSGFLAQNVFTVTGVSKIGLSFASVALFMGSIFFLYSFKYYLTLAIVLSYSQKSLGVGGRKYVGSQGLLARILGFSGSNNGQQGHLSAGLEPDLSHITLSKRPYVSVQIPFYNEKNVVRRSIEAAINFNYPEYEIILCDDSTDQTTDIISVYMKDYLGRGEKLHEVRDDVNGWILTSIDVKPGVTLKHLHRTTRDGYKGKALDLALKLCDPRTEFVSIFDADFVPYPDSLEMFLKYFKFQNNLSEDYKTSNVGAVQGYQWHVLNKSENWITRGVRSEYAGSYVIERSGAEIYGGMKQISGSVYMIRHDVLAEIGWGSSITEDFELTLRLYEKGYKVLYTPYVQAPAECVSTLRRLVRQRMRWAEGHSFNVKKMFKKLMMSPKLTIVEKLEFAYLTPYYLQAFFFIVGTFCWLLAESVFRARLPFWTELWGWSLILTNMIALPLVNGVGLFIEESEEKDFMGLGSFIVLSYLLVPFQAYSAVKGLLEENEGPWFRTPKTGRITDIFSRGRFYKFIAGILPGKSSEPSLAVSPYLALSTANSRFNNFDIKPIRISWLGKAILSGLLIISTTFLYLSHGVTTVYATNMAGPLKLGLGTDGKGGTWPAWGNYMQNTTSYSTGVAFRLQSSFAGTATNNWTWYTPMLPTGTVDGSIPSGAYYLQMARYNGRVGIDQYNYGIQLLLTNNNGIARTQILGSKFAISLGSANNALTQYSLGTLGAAQPITAANPNRLSFRIFWINGSNGSGWTNMVVNNTTVPARLIIPADITVPEVSKVALYVVMMVIIPIAPALIEGRFRKKKFDLIRESADAWRDLLAKLFGTETEKLLDNLPV